MELLYTLLDFVLHVDRHLTVLMEDYGGWTYAVLFLIVFCETGLVVTPFLPGDSLLFAAGALAALGGLNVHLLALLLVAAAILGDTVNYTIGRRLGERILRQNLRLLNRAQLERTQAFYEKHGGKTIVLARFMPIVRTFAPFVAGIGRMQYDRFLTYNVVGGIVWVVLFLYAGFFFGNQPVVKENFTLVILAIIVLSILPPLVEYLRHRLGGAAPPPPPDAARPKLS